jgi:hypothetical protein
MVSAAAQRMQLGTAAPRAVVMFMCLVPVVDAVGNDPAHLKLNSVLEHV